MVHNGKRKKRFLQKVLLATKKAWQSTWTSKQVYSFIPLSEFDRLCPLLLFHRAENWRKVPWLPFVCLFVGLFALRDHWWADEGAQSFWHSPSLTFTGWFTFSLTPSTLIILECFENCSFKKKITTTKTKLLNKQFTNGLLIFLPSLVFHLKATGDAVAAILKLHWKSLQKTAAESERQTDGRDLHYNHHHRRHCRANVIRWDRFPFGSDAFFFHLFLTLFTTTTPLNTCHNLKAHYTYETPFSRKLNWVL